MNFFIINDVELLMTSPETSTLGTFYVHKPV